MEKDIALGQDEDTQHGRYLTFALGVESYGLEISTVKEIVGMQPITGMPGASSCVKGIINLRGSIISVMDMRLKFGKDETDYTDRTCIVVIDIGEMTAGLIVDNVSEVVSIDDESIEPLPSNGTGAQSRFIKGIGKVGNEIKLLLDVDELFVGIGTNPSESLKA